MRSVGVQVGYSLIEMLFAVAMVCTVVATGIPEIFSQLTNMRLKSAMNGVCSGLRLARAEAIRRNGYVVMCKSSDGKQCSRTGDWSQGWIIFHDVNNSRLVDGSETVLYREAPISSNMLLTGNTPIAKDVAYSFSGEAILPGGGFQAGTFTVAPKELNPSFIYCIAVNKRGTHRVYKSYTGACHSD